MTVQHVVYEDNEVSVALVLPDGDTIEQLAIRWLETRVFQKDGKAVEASNHMGGATDWFILPFTFGAAVGRVLIELKLGAAVFGFREEGYLKLVEWLVTYDEWHSGMQY